MRPKFLQLLLVAALLAAFLVAPMGAAAQTPPTNPLAGIPVAGTIPLPGGLTGAFTGTLDVVRFAVQNGQLVAIGELTGTLTNATGGLIGTVTDFPVTLPVTGISGRCDVLDLTLGPLDLDLLGLEVHLNQVELDVVAQAGAGKLLGNLLCAVAGLLDNPASPLAGVAALLNRILGALG